MQPPQVLNHDPIFAGDWATEHSNPQNLGHLDTQNPVNSNPQNPKTLQPARAPLWVQRTVRWIAQYPKTSLGIATAIVIIGFAANWARPQAPEQGQAPVATETVQAPPTTYDPQAANKQAMTRTAVVEKEAFKSLVARAEAEGQAYLADRIRAYLRFSLTLVGQESTLAQQQGRPARWVDQATVLQGLLEQKSVELEEASRKQNAGQASSDLAIGTIINETKAILGALKAVENKDVSLESNPADPAQTAQPLLFAGDMRQYVSTRQTLQLATSEFQRAVGSQATQNTLDLGNAPANYVPIQQGGQ